MATLGFSFSGKDDGVTKMMDKTRDGLAALNSDIEKSGKDAEKGASRLRTAFAAINTFQLGTITSQLDSLVNAGGNLTSQYEATFTSMNTAAKPFALQMGKTGADAQKATAQISQMAYALNTGPESVGRAMLAVETSGKAVKGSLDLMGVGVKDMIKAEKSFGADSQQLVGVMGDLKQAWGFSDEEVADLIDGMAAAGKEGGTLAQTFKTLPKTMEIINQQAFAMGKSLSPAEIKKMAVQVEAVSAAFVGMGSSQEDAASSALKVFDTLEKEEINQEKMVAGLGGEFSDVFKQLARRQNFEAVQDVFKMAPADAIKSLRAMRQELQAGIAAGTTSTEALQDFDAGIHNVDSNLLALVQTEEKNVAVLDSVSKASENASGSFKNLAKEGFATGLTLQDSYDRAKVAAKQAFRSIGREETRDFVRSQRKAFREVAKETRALGADSTWGPLLQKMSMIQQTGVAGAVRLGGEAMGMKDLDKTAAKAGMLAETLGGIASGMGPAMQTFGAIAPMIGKFLPLLMNPVVLVGAAIVGLYYFRDEIIAWFKDEFPAVWDNFKTQLLAGWERVKKWWKDESGDAWESFKDGLAAGWLAIVTWFNSVDWKGLVTKIRDGIQAGLQTAARFVQDFNLKPYIDSLFGSANQAMAETDWISVFMAIFTAIVDTFLWIAENIYPILVDFVSLVFTLMMKSFEIMGEWAVAIGALLVNMFVMAFNYFTEQLSALWRELVVHPFEDLVYSIVTPIEALGVNLYNAGAAIVQQLWDGLKSTWGDMTAWFDEGLSGLRAIMPGSEPKDPQSPLRGLGESGSALIDNIAAGMVKREDSFKKLFSDIMRNVAVAGIAAFNEEVTKSVEAMVTGFAVQIDAVNNEVAEKLARTTEAMVNAISQASGQDQTVVQLMIANEQLLKIVDTTARISGFVEVMATGNSAALPLATPTQIQ